MRDVLMMGEIDNASSVLQHPCLDDPCHDGDEGCLDDPCHDGDEGSSMS